MDSLPEPPPSKPKQTIQFSLLALLLLVFGAGMLFATGPFGVVLGLGGMSFLGLLALHYVVWGRWVSRELDVEPNDGTSEPPSDS